ncbi:MAG TPA: hypothetical protein VH744_13820, partial [Terriglobales bacterium]
MGNWQQIKDVFHAALDLPPDRRIAFLQQACPEPSLRHEVESLLESHQSAGELLETPALQLTAEIDDHEDFDF